MITREQLRQLAEFQSSQGNAVSFYFHPGIPQNKAHREEHILVKDLVHDALASVPAPAMTDGLRSDLNRIAALGEKLPNNHTRGKAILACAQSGIWVEIDFAAGHLTNRLIVNSRFHLAPLTAALSESAPCCVAVVDREKALISKFDSSGLALLEEVFNPTPRRVRTAGFAGYEAGHIERHIDNEAMRHFKQVADRIRELLETHGFEGLIIACRDESWPEIEPHLHAYLKQRLLGRFSADPATPVSELVRATQSLLDERNISARQALIHEVLGEAHRNARGVLGLRQVLLALEKGEVHTLLLGPKFSARAVECRHCGHMDTRTMKNCTLCGKETSEVEDIADALVADAIRRGAEIVQVNGDPSFDAAGNVGALLRFRSDQNTAERLAS
jgi:peptide chain release factor subunit 1